MDNDGNDSIQYQMERVLQGLMPAGDNFDADAIISDVKDREVTYQHISNICAQIIRAGVGSADDMGEILREHYREAPNISDSDDDHTPGRLNVPGEPARPGSEGFLEAEANAIKERLHTPDERTAKLSRKQRFVIDQVTKKNDLFCILGGAGTGKTFLVNIIIDTLIRDHNVALVSATTAAAGEHLNGTTVHRMFGFIGDIYVCHLVVRIGYAAGAPARDRLFGA